jgi:hypothetical protein
LTPGAAASAAWEGPGRFCGYGPIIDLLPAESIKTLNGGIHGGWFEWTGLFGTLEVYGIQWAARPRDRPRAGKTPKGLIRFGEVKRDGLHELALWNGRQGAAYFRSKSPLTKLQRQAIERVDLFQEGEEPTGCKYRTVFSWE